MMKYFAIVNALNVIQLGFQQEVPDVGPAPRLPFVEGCTHVELSAPFVRDHPSPTAVPYAESGSVVWVEAAPLDELKERQKQLINLAHELANKTSFMFQGKEIQANDHSMRQIEITNSGVLRRGTMRPGWLGAWKTLDNSYVAIPDVATWNQFLDAIEQTGTQNFDKAQQLKAAIDAAQTIEEISAIVWQSPEPPA
jgi:hypothetical protein